MQRKQFSEENKVIINIWGPQINEQPASQFGLMAVHYMFTFWNATVKRDKRIEGAWSGRLGHVSMETPNKYASWFADRSDESKVGVFNVVNAGHLSDFDADCEFEDDEEPDARICLYSLDTKVIETAIARVENSDYGYVLAGNKKITRLVNERKGNSCSGLIYDLLMEGGLNNLLYSYQDIVAKWLVTTPENMMSLIQHAKEYELKAYPETQKFSDQLSSEELRSRFDAI